MNKRGQGLSTSTIVLLILGLIILVILILGFTMGWNRLFPFLSSNNVQNIVNACETACSVQGTYDFCTFERELNDGEIPKFKTTCNELSTKTEYAKYGVKVCTSITCPVAETPAQ